MREREEKKRNVILNVTSEGKGQQKKGSSEKDVEGIGSESRDRED